jgi:molecular chaperone DnaK
MPQIEVTFDIDANGILHVAAKDKATGKSQSIRITASSGLSEEEIKQMVRDAEANVEADKKFADLVQARNTAEGLVHATRKTLSEAGDKVTAAEKEQIEAAIKQVEDVVQSDDQAAIDSAVQKLTEVSSNMAQKMYAEAQAAQQAGAQGGDNNSGTDGKDDVVDAEFEEVKDDRK